MKILSFAELCDLMASRPARDQFGPLSDMPYLVFEIGSENSQLASDLQALPCPVIGFQTDICAPDIEAACDVVLDDVKLAERICDNIAQTPMAALVLVQQLRLSENLPIDQALLAESFAYASLQKSPLFLERLEQIARVEPLAEDGPVLLLQTDRDKATQKEVLSLSLNRPANLNAMNTELRDALAEAFEMARLNDAITEVVLSAQGKSFSIGGALHEFGEAPDALMAHMTRTYRLPAQFLARLDKPLRVHIDGAAIGAGIEMAAFAQHLTATEKAWFQLPELKYGLIPGAGGTVSVLRRIGRHKTALMALSMKKISAQTAYEWGLVDALV